MSIPASAIAADLQGGLFFADKRNGLGHIDPAGQLSYFDISDGLIDNEVRDLDVDNQGTIWVATRGGLSSYQQGMWTSFGPRTGLDALELWPVVATDGRILVGAAGKGTFQLNLDEAGAMHPRVWFSPTVASENGVLIRWQTLSFEGPLPQIQNRTRTDEGVWSAWTLEREITLPGLSAGEHSFDVQAAGMTGQYHEPGYTVRFDVAPSLYSRPVFYLPVGLSGFTVILLAIVSVSRRRRDAAALGESEMRYRIFFQQAPISLWEQDYSEVWAYIKALDLSDEDALRAHLTPRVVYECTGRIRILDANDATLELFECEDVATLAQQMQRIFRREAYPALLEGIVALHSGQLRFSHETVAYSLKDTPLHVILSFAVVPSSKVKYERVLVSVLDVTVQQQAAEEMRAAALAAEEANQAKSAFLANTSHEIRTPINAVMGMAQALQEEELSPRAADQVETVLRAAESLSEIIDDLLDLSKIEAGQLELVCLPFDPADVVEGARQTLATRAADKGIGLSLTVDESTPAEVEGDRVRLRQVLLNLLGNAVKFTEEGNVDIHLRAEPVGGELLLHFEVHDSGIGISQQQVHVIFDRFSQADSSITRTHGGTGLGLSISKRLVEMMGGSIEVHSEPGVGSTFRFHIRVKPGTGRLRRQESTEEVDTKPMRILLVEDNLMNRKVANALLRSDAHDITEAEDGAIAVELFRNDPSFDLILMDLQMPVMDGIAATVQIRQIEAEAELSRTPIVALMANAMQGDRDRCLQVGMDDFISKPVRKQNLRAVLARLQPASLHTTQDAQVEDPVQEDPTVLDPVPLQQLRELEASVDFSVTEFVELFQNSAPACLQRGRLAYDASDLEAVEREVHTLKGMSREVGARELAERAEFWELRLREGDKTDIGAGLDELQTLVAQASTALQAWASADSD
jgi:signal transduction histidine kinase/DNA-binding response OmpR family regulator